MRRGRKGPRWTNDVLDNGDVESVEFVVLSEEAEGAGRENETTRYQRRVESEADEGKER